EGESLRLDVAVAGAKGEAGIAVRQGGRQHTMRLLITVAKEEMVRRRQVVIDLGVDLVVLPRQRRVDQVVVDRLSVGGARAGGVRLGNQLIEHLSRSRIEAVE